MSKYGNYLNINSINYKKEIAMSKLPAHISQQLPSFAEKAPQAGNENVTADDLKIPMLKVLQALSPELQEDNAKYIEGAKAGMIANTVTGEAVKSVKCMNLFYKKQFVLWLKREAGGGKVAEFDSKEAAQQYMTDSGLDPSMHDIAETATHYLLLLNDDASEIVGQAIVPMTGTGLGVSDNWNSQIQMTGAPQRFLSVWELGTLKRANSKGSWYVFDPKFIGYQQNKEVFDKALEDYAAVSGKALPNAA